MTVTELLEELTDALEMGVSGDADVVLVHRKRGSGRPVKDYVPGSTLKAEAGNPGTLYLTILRAKD